MDLGRGLFVIKRENMNIKNELDKAWQKAQSFPGELAILGPNDLDPDSTADIFRDLLEKTYIRHGVSQHADEFSSAIRAGEIEPCIVTRDNQPVACAALIKQSDGTSELGRAVSVELGTGAGKIAMLTAALSAGTSPLVAEIRLANTFAGIPGGEATQRICHGILGLTIHAIVPPFRHGRHPDTQTPYNEVFGFAAKNVPIFDSSPLSTANQAISTRINSSTPVKDMQLMQVNPFRIAVPVDSGINIEDFQRGSRFGDPGCTMTALEANDQNISTIAWLIAHDFVLSGVDRNLGENGLPVLLLATLAHGTMLAPTKASDTLPQQLRADILHISSQFNQLVERG